MAAPVYSPSGGVGTTVTDSEGQTWRYVQYPNSSGFWQNVTSTQAPPQTTVATSGQSTGTGVDPTTQALLDYIKNALAAPQTTTSATPSQTVSINPANLQIQPISTLQKQILADPKFTAYYDQLLKQVNYDVNEAVRVMNYQYQTGTAQLAQDTALKTERTTQDLTSALQALGLQNTKDKNALVDTLNKRGIALVQAGGPQSAATKVADPGSVSYDAQGNPIFSGQGGQAGTELTQLSEDQRLRKEAEQRTAQRNLQDIGIAQTRGQQQLEEQKTEAGYAASAKQAKDTASIKSEEQGASLQQAQLAQQQQSQKAQLELQKAQMQKEGIDFPGSVSTILSSL